MIKLDLKSINLYDIDFEKFTPKFQIISIDG